jgi:hypothetical protein
MTPDEFSELMAQLEETNNDFRFLLSHVDLDHLPDLHTLENCAMHLESLSMLAARHAAVSRWSADERANFLRAAMCAAEAQGVVERRRAKLISDEAIAQAKQSTLH